MRGPELKLEGDVSAVMRALVLGSRVKVVYPPGGMACAMSTGFAATRERYLHPLVPRDAYGVSAGGCNALAEAYGAMRQLARAYYRGFCTEQFVKAGCSGFIAWFTGEKVDLGYYEYALAELMRGLRPSHVANCVRFGVTDFETAERRTITADLWDLSATVRAARASAQLPCAGDGFTEIDGRRYTDGGVADPFPLRSAVEQDTKFLLVVMPHPEQQQTSRIRSLVERVMFSRLYRFPSELRKALLTIESRFRAELTSVRAELELPHGHPLRQLPHVAIAWPETSIDIVEQRVPVVRSALNHSRRAWSKAFDTALPHVLT